MVAYHCGKAANVAPPAVSSHTSLPSQTGPMALIMSRRSVSSRPRNGSRIPTPKSNPFQHEVPGPQDRDEDEPERREVHDSSLTMCSVLSFRAQSAGLSRRTVSYTHLRA